ncbi:ATPase, V1 complex, subunit C [Meredithblackwellia eburnea MCA 4105]
MSGPTTYWITSFPLESSPEDQLSDLQPVLAKNKLGTAYKFEFPQFKTGTLSSLMTLSDQLAKHDPFVTSTLSKVVETLKTLVSTPAPSSSTSSSTGATRTSPLSTHLLLPTGQHYLDFLTNFKWDQGKYRVESRSLSEMVESMVKEVNGIENAQRSKTQGYQLVKGQLTTAARKKTGNLSIRSLADIVTADDFKGTADSEYLTTALVAVPKNLVKEWETSYERLTSMVVPRSATKLASDDEFILYSVAIFRRVLDEFSQKCRENKFIVRDFTYNPAEIAKAEADALRLESEEKELWADLLRLSRINFGDIFQILVHLKVVRAFTESVLRYGLPAAYFGAIIKPESKNVSKLGPVLLQTYSSILPKSSKSRQIKGGSSSNDDSGDAPMGEFASVLEGEYWEFVRFELETVE